MGLRVGVVGATGMPSGKSRSVSHGFASLPQPAALFAMLVRYGLRKTAMTVVEKAELAQS